MSEATITWISGPVLRAQAEQPFYINEAVSVGGDRLLGEVMRIDGGEIAVQVYEDTTGLRPGDQVVGAGSPLAIRLGPGLLGNIYDGLLRPLSADGATYVRAGMTQPPARTFAFTPTVLPGRHLDQGAFFGNVHPPTGKTQRCLVPPGQSGEIVRIAPAGEYAEDAPLVTLRAPDGTEHAVAMSHWWPVRRPRPVAARLALEGPLFTGQRILDSLFPLGCGSRAALPGGFGTGKTILQETLAKWCDADIIVYVGCGERGNEMAGVLHEFPRLEDPHTGRPLMERTVIIANTSNMPVAAREASIYTGLTLGEYFRDQGLRVALMADSTSRWAEALREISGRLGELPSEGGHPAYLSSRLAEFYERAAHVRTLSDRIGSLSIIGAVSPPSADFSEPVTTHTKRYVRCFWALDATRAQARFYPAVHPLLSYSENVQTLRPWWHAQGHAQWEAQRRQFLTLLEQQARLERMARIVGKDALPPRQQHVLLCAELINEAFLRQSAFSPVDHYCSPTRQMHMMQLIARFIELSQDALAAGVAVEQLNQMSMLRRLRRMGEEIPPDQNEQFQSLRVELETEFAQLTRATATHAG